MSIGLIHRRPTHPWTALRQAERTLDRLNQRAAQPRRVADAFRSYDPRLEAVETEDGYDVTAEMPGVARSDLEVTVQEGVLTLKGARRYGRPTAEAIDVGEAEADASDGQDAQDAQDENVVRFERRIRFNADVDEEAIVARYTDGVLELHVPKQTPPEPEVRTIPVEVG